VVDSRFSIGQRVLYQGRPGTIVYWRLRPPDFAVVHSVSVRLDDRAAECPTYTSTLVLPGYLVPLPKE
jgi:hypothetical protein